MDHTSRPTGATTRASYAILKPESPPWLRAILVLIFVGLSACGTGAPAGAPGAPGKIKIVATFSILGDMVQRVAGDRADLATLVGPASDVHEFEPAPSDALRLAGASVIVENGLGLETWLDRFYQASGSRAVRLVTGLGIAPRTLTRADGSEEIDPHVWQDVTNAILMVQNIRDGLARADPPNAAAYQANAGAYIAQLRTLDQEIVAMVDQLPAGSRKLVTSHDSLGYFAQHYGFTIVGSLLGTVATASGDPSAKVFAQLVQDIKSTGVKAVFVESVANPANMERLASEAGVRVGPQLYTDSLGAPGSAGDSYINAMRHNARSIVDALLG